MSSISSYEILNDLKLNIVSKINKIIIFGNNGDEVVFSTRDGNVYAFGANIFGGLGFGHKNSVKEPKIIEELNGKQVNDFSYGLDFVLGKTMTGKLYSWGENDLGQLGIGTNTSDYRPKLIESLSDKFVTDIKCGHFHSLVLTDNNELYGFGYNISGQIGCGNTDNKWTPIKIIGFDNETIVSIACGGEHSLALTQTGNIYGWGGNNFGQLGIDRKDQESIVKPTKIILSIGSVVKKIVCGQIHSLILAECGDVYAFEDLNHSVITKIDNVKNVKDIAAHFRCYISMAKLEDNTYHVWIHRLNDFHEDVPELKTTKINSFNDIIALAFKITLQSIECFSYTNRLLNNIYNKFNDKYFSDIVFIIDGKLIFINKFILRANSDYFQSKYSLKSNEIKKSSILRVDDIEVENIEVIDNYSYEVFYSYLKYIYTDCIEIENQYLVQLLILSIDHKEEDLMIQCSERIFSLDKNWITIENIVKLIKYSSDKNMTELKAKFIDRIKSMTTIDNICNVYEVSIDCKLKVLENNCFEFINELKDKSLILKTDSYKKWSNDMKLEFVEKTISMI